MATECTLRFLVGPTACGKSETGIVLAERLGAEIISLDSMAVYRGMDIGTAKPNAEEKARIPHHMIDVADPWQSYSVAKHVRQAEEVAREILARDREVLFVGGTGLYLKRFVEGIFEGPQADRNFREECRERAVCEGVDALHEELRVVDPEAAERLHPNDIMRVIRALEVYHISGRPQSVLQAEDRKIFAEQRREFFGVDKVSYLTCAMNREREDLNERINRRVDKMFAAGLMDEVIALCERSRPHLRPAGQERHRLGPQADKALGYKEILAFLNGEISHDKAIEQTKLHTRQFATKQMTWFRNFPRMRYIEVNSSDDAFTVAQVAADILRGGN